MAGLSQGSEPAVAATPKPAVAGSPEDLASLRHGRGGRAWRHGSGGVMTDTQMVKKSIVVRAKYRLEQGPGPTRRVLSPLLVVPHPRNRGGGPVKSLRTKELATTILVDGCDPLEACNNAVAVQEQTEKAWS